MQATMERDGGNAAGSQTDHCADDPSTHFGGTSAARRRTAPTATTASGRP